MASHKMLHKEKFQAFKKWLEENDQIIVIEPAFTDENCLLRWKDAFPSPDETGFKEKPRVFVGSSLSHYHCNLSARPYITAFLKEYTAKPGNKGNHHPRFNEETEQKARAPVFKLANNLFRVPNHNRP